MKKRLPNIQFSMAADGYTKIHKDKNNYFEFNSLSVSNISIRTYENIVKFYEKQSILILRSTYNEGLPAVAMECQAMGIPILLNDVPRLLKLCQRI